MKTTLASLRTRKTGVLSFAQENAESSPAIPSSKAWPRLWRYAPGLIIGLTLVVGIGCGGRTSQRVTTWSELVEQLGDFDRLARLDLLSSALVSSADPTGSNNDYNRFLRPSRTPGWVVLADLKGPGYVTRLWFTCSSRTHPLRFYFDGEKQPRIETTLIDFCGTRPPFLSPLAGDENVCWYSFVPIPYQKRLIIETRAPGNEPGGWPRFFYQVNYADLPAGQTVNSFPAKLSDADNKLIDRIRKRWRDFPAERPLPGRVLAETNLLMQAGAVTEVLDVSGPALLRSLWIEPDFKAITNSVAAREQILRDVVLRIRWNRVPFASVETPLGDFFGSCWQRARYQSLFFGLTNDTFISRWPMPFETAASISLENQGPHPVSVKAGVKYDPLEAWDPAWGYFHSGWYRTGPENVGQPHPVLRTQGRGKYVGCIMTVTSGDRNYWILEGNESIRKDQETVPGWRGTGLEDYFNGGWYYRNVQTFPMHGVPFKASFRAVQYSLHLVNPTLFQSSLEMVFERGPGQASRGWMESVAYYYLAQPGPAFARLGAPAARRPPPDEFTQATLMTEIWNFERFHDYQGASDYIDRYLETFINFPFTEVLRLRQAAYQERERGFAAVRPVYEQFAASTNDMVRQYAKILLWFHESPANALIGAFANTRTKVYLDGKLVGEAGHPERTMVWGLQIQPGPHVLVMESQYQEYPSWAQMMLRTHQGDFFTTPKWKHAINPPPGWLNPAYDDQSWAPAVGTAKGPPAEQYVWVMPDPFIDMQSVAAGLAPSMEWPEPKRGLIVYRYRFEIPKAQQLKMEK